MATQNRKQRTPYGNNEEARSRNGQLYVYGNTVRKPVHAPLEQEEQRPVRPARESKQRLRNRRKAMHMNLGYVTFLAVAAIVGLLTCVQFLQLRAEVTQRSADITAMQKELSVMHEKNTTRYNAIMDSVNLEDIKYWAIQDLGMVYAEEGQIIEYKNPSNDYVKQYEAIPESGILAASERVSQ